MSDPPKKKEENKKEKAKAKHGVASAVSADISQQGRPLANETLEHGFKADYNPRNYTTLGDPQTKDKVQIPLLEDDNVDWKTFHIPKTLPPGGSQWWLDATPAQKREAWKAATTGVGGTEDPGDLAKVRRRLHDLMQILPIHFSVMIAEIRHKRDYGRYRRRKLRQRMVEEDEEARAELDKNRNKDAALKKGNCCSRCGVHTSLAASVIHYSACFHVGVMTIAAIVQQLFDIQELNEVFPSSGVYSNPVTNRIFGVIGLSLVLMAMFIGTVGHFFRSTGLLRLYMLMFLGGAVIFACQSWTENYYSRGDGLSGVFKGQVKDFLKSGPKKAKFLLQAQDKFRCCGDKSPLDYGSAASSNGKLKLPPTCCEQKATVTPDCSLTKGQPIPDFVHSRGCTSPVKTFLGHLFMLRMVITPFLLFVAVVGIIAAINLDRHHPFICSCCRKKKTAVLNPTKYAKQVLFKRTEAEILLDDIEEASTSIAPPNKSKYEFENDSVRGSLGYVRRKLGDCETLTDFILVVVHLLHQTEAFQESELSAKRPDPEVIARVILGFRPKKFVTPSLIEHDFERILHDAQFDPKLRSELGRRSLAIRMNMQEVVEDQSELLAKKEEHLEHHNLMGFPLPRPLSGVRVSEWRRVTVGPNDFPRITRRDKYTIYEDDHLDPLDPAYMEEDRILHLAAPPGESSCLSKWCHKTFPYWYELSVEEYLFLEDALYAPAFEVLSKIITEAQGILCDIHRKARFRKFSVSANLEPPEPTKSRQKSISQASEVDIQKVNDCLKLLMDSEAIQEERMTRWIRKQMDIANAEVESSPSIPIAGPSAAK